MRLCCPTPIIVNSIVCPNVFIAAWGRHGRCRPRRVWWGSIFAPCRPPGHHRLARGSPQAAALPGVGAALATAVLLYAGLPGGARGGAVYDDSFVLEYQVGVQGRTLGGAGAG